VALITAVSFSFSLSEDSLDVAVVVTPALLESVVNVLEAVLGVVLLLTSLLLDNPAPLVLVNVSGVLLEMLVMSSSL
jgi:hypothetical protein